MVSALHKSVTYLLRDLPTYVQPWTHTGLKFSSFERYSNYTSRNFIKSNINRTRVADHNFTTFSF